MPHDDDDERPAVSGRASPPSQPRGDMERVGYKRPPKRTRFTKGQSGNPKGRPKGSLNLATIRAHVAAHWFEEKIKVTINGRERKMVRFDVLLMKQRDLALKGDPKVIKDCMDLILRMVEGDVGPRVCEENAAEDAVILNTHLSMTRADAELSSGVPESFGEDDDG